MKISANKRLKIPLLITGIFLFLLAAGIAYYLFFNTRTRQRGSKYMLWAGQPDLFPQWAIQAKTRCGDAPFLMPTTGYVGFLWDDSFRPGHRHQGIDIFGGKGEGVTPVYTVHDGYLTRLADWKSSLILRIPQDPLHPERQIWVYYTHMASGHDPEKTFIDRQFPAGTHELPVKAGELLGYQGDYSGDPLNPVAVHLHLSIVRDDGKGGFLNELDINNTYDPSPYFNLSLNAQTNRDQVPVCLEQNKE